MTRYLKAQGTELILGFAIIFAVALGLLICIGLWGAISTSPTYQHYFNQTSTQNTIIIGVNSSFSILATSVVLLWAGFMIASWLLAAASEANIAFGILGFLVLIPDMILSFVFHDAFFSLMKSTFLAAVVNQFPAIIYFFQYTPVAALVGWAVIMFLTFVK